MTATAKQTKQTKTEKITLYSLAREVTNECDGDLGKATKRLARRLGGDRRLLESLLVDVVRVAVQTYCASAQSNMRHEIVNKAGRAEVVALSNGLMATYLDWPLARGVKLRAATREEVAEQIERHGGLWRTNKHIHDWLTLIVQCVPAGKLVGDVIDDDRAAELYREAA